MRVLVTGAAGAIGRPVSEYFLLQGDFVRAFDRDASMLGSETFTGALEDPLAVQTAVAGMDAIVHLGANPHDAPFPELIGPNVLGLYNVLDAAREAGLRRVIVASSVQVGGRQKGMVFAEHRAPANHYALTKLLAEEMGAFYARSFGLDVIAARIGWMVRDHEEAARIQRSGLTRAYVSRADVARFCYAAVHAPFKGFAVLYAIGPDGHERYDLDSPRRAIGYEPLDAWPRGLPFELPIVAG